MPSKHIRLLHSLRHNPPTTSLRHIHQTRHHSTDISAGSLPKVSIAPKRAIAPRVLPKNFIPQPLGAPIGVQRRPKPTDDPIADELAARRAQSKDWQGRLDSNTETRRYLLKSLDRSHVRDYRNIANAAQGGKFYVANTALYKANAAMYWPNLTGKTLRGDKANSTDLLNGWVSVVCFFQRNWGFEQTRSFVGAKGNPELAAILEANKDTVQTLDVTMEDLQTFTILKRVFEFNLRRQKSAEEQDRYFITEGIPVGVKESIGVMNSAIGYVFLVDRNCKIRWSACATALPEEKESLLKGVQSLIRQAKEKIS